MPVTLRNRYPRPSRLTQNTVTNNDHAQVHGIGNTPEPCTRITDTSQPISNFLEHGHELHFHLVEQITPGSS